MSFKRVLLIAPRFYEGKYQLSFHPAAGLGYVAESLKTAGFFVTVFDMNLQYNYNDLQKKISEFKPDILGFTAMTFGHRNLYKMINQVRTSFPEIKIVIGGPHVSTLKEKVLQDCPGIDYGIILEGDVSLVELCVGKELDKIPGLIYRRNGEIVMNKFEEFIRNLDLLPFPKYEAFELNKYPTRQIGIVTSRGCPYNCIYCPVIAAIGKRFRMRSAQSVIDEIEYWYKRGYREILIMDDNFTLVRKRVEEICALLHKINFKGIQLKCPNGIRADRVDRQLLKEMKEAGFVLVAFGVETASNKVLKNIKKGEDIEIIEQCIKNACELGFDVDLFFLIGSPGETMEDLKASFSLALRYPVRTAKFYNIIPFPATELFEWLSKNGYLLHPIDTILNHASHFINEPCFTTPEMSKEKRIKAFSLGQTVSLEIRKKYIERRINAPYLLKKLFSHFYTMPFAETMLNNNRAIVQLKEMFKLFALK